MSNTNTYLELTRMGRRRVDSEPAYTSTMFYYSEGDPFYFVPEDPFF